MKKNIDSFSKHAMTFEGMKLILGGAAGSGSGSGTTSGVQSISCTITLDGVVPAGGECAADSVELCYQYAGKMCDDYVKNNRGSCIIGKCA